MASKQKLNQDACAKKRNNRDGGNINMLRETVSSKQGADINISAQNLGEKQRSSAQNLAMKALHPPLQTGP